MSFKTYMRSKILVFHSFALLVNPCKECYLIQVHGVVSEVHGTLVIVFTFVAFPPSCRQVDVPFLLPWFQHGGHHQVVPDQELRVYLVGCFVINSDPPEGPNDWVSSVQDLTGQFKNPWSHQRLVELRELPRYLHHL